MPRLSRAPARLGPRLPAGRAAGAAARHQPVRRARGALPVRPDIIVDAGDGAGGGVVMDEIATRVRIVIDLTDDEAVQLADMADSI